MAELRNVDVNEARELASQGALLLDVREDDEWRSGRAPGAVHVPLAELPGAPEITILVGSEREGLPDSVVAQADRIAQIPIRTHSLNAAMAATVALYDLGHRMPPA